MRHIWLLILLALAGVAHAAKTVYVDDKLIITLRTGKGNGYQILRTLPSGTALEMIKSDGEYAHVRTPDGTEGWVRTQYLTGEPVAAQRLTQAESRLERTQEANKSLESRLAKLQGERDRLEQARAKLAARSSQLETKLEKLRQLSETPIQLSRENKAMKSRIGQLEATLSSLTETNKALQDDSYRDWFIAGAGVLGTGILLGLLLPRLRRRRKSGWDF
jgi:SH3 domain protein